MRLNDLKSEKLTSESDSSIIVMSGFDCKDSPFKGPIVVPIQDSIDLHPFAPKDIPSVVEEYIGECVPNGIYDVRIIHGRGIGVQRNIVRSLLERHANVVSFHDAPSEGGGWGATVVRLKDLSAR
jgi:DNA-nicking Smr family endonuclease